MPDNFVPIEIIYDLYVRACHNAENLPSFCLGMAKSQLRQQSFYYEPVWLCFVVHWVFMASQSGPWSIKFEAKGTFVSKWMLRARFRLVDHELNGRGKALVWTARGLIGLVAAIVVIFNVVVLNNLQSIIVRINDCYDVSHTNWKLLWENNYLVYRDHCLVYFTIFQKTNSSKLYRIWEPPFIICLQTLHTQGWKRSCQRVEKVTKLFWQINLGRPISLLSFKLFCVRFRLLFGLYINNYAFIIFIPFHNYNIRTAWPDQLKFRLFGKLSKILSGKL